MATDQRLSTWLEYLPAVLQEGPFIGRFLLAFEAVLSGLEAPAGGEPAGLPPVGIEQRLDRIHGIFDPLGDAVRDGTDPPRTPVDFLPWLAQWVATTLRDDWDEPTRRDFIRKIVPLYGLRGTRLGLQKVLEIVTPDVVVTEFDDDTKPPHYFQVTVTVRTRDPLLLVRRIRMVRAIVDREKPAHTIYGLVIEFPAMRINNNPGDPDELKKFGPGITIGTPTSILGTTTFTG